MDFMLQYLLMAKQDQGRHTLWRDTNMKKQNKMKEQANQ